MTPQGVWYTTYPGDESGGCFAISGGVVYNGGCGIHRRIRYVRFAGVVSLLLLLLYRCCTTRVLLRFKGSVGWNRPGCCVQQDGTHTQYAHTCTQKHHSSQCHTKKILKYGCCCTMHGCHNVENLAFGVTQVHSNIQHRQPKGKSQIAPLSLLQTVFS